MGSSICIRFLQSVYQYVTLREAIEVVVVGLDGNFNQIGFCNVFLRCTSKFFCSILFYRPKTILSATCQRKQETWNCHVL